MLTQVTAPGLQLGGLVGLAIAVEATDLLGDGVHLVADLIPFLGEGPLPGVQLDDPIET